MNEYPQQYPQTIPIPVRANDDFEKWRFDLEELLVEKEMNIMGFFWNPKAKDGAGDWEEAGEPRVNKIGAKAIRTVMSGVVNKVSTLTTLDIDEIMMEVRIVTLNLNRLFFLHHDKYGLKSPSDAQDLLWQMALFAFNGLKQSQGGKSLESLTSMSQTIRHIGDQQKQGYFHLPRFPGTKEKVQ